MYLDLIIIAESQCTHGDLRLVGGSGTYEGNVQICFEGVWGWVCHNSWSTYDAQVVCRQLGFSTTSLSIHRNYTELTHSPEETLLLCCRHILLYQQRVSSASHAAWDIQQKDNIRIPLVQLEFLSMPVNVEVKA